MGYGEVEFHEEEENFTVSELEEEEKESSMIDMELEAPPHDETNKDKILDDMLDNIVSREEYKSGIFYKCRVCKKALKQKEMLRRHAETHVTGFKHKCLYCGRFYKTRPSLSFHMNGHKKEMKIE